MRKVPKIAAKINIINAEYCFTFLAPILVFKAILF